MFAESKMTRIVFSAFATFMILFTNVITAEEKGLPSYFEVGITASSLMIHPSVGFWWGRYGLRLTGMYLNTDHNEFHLNIGYRLSDSRKVQHSINLLTSWVAGSDPGADYKYGATGLAYSLNYRGFFFELGVAHPWRDDIGNLANNPVVPCGYVGYIYRFRPE